jgi:pimeloyl-ACP methyl ester carboxylesterase
MIMDVDVTQALPAITAPVLCLRALRDRVVPAAAADWMAAHLPQAHIVNIDSPHMLLQTRPIECAQAILQFVRDTTG